MLVLSRAKDQGLVIGDGIVVTVLKISRKHVKIGVEAPDDIKVLRGEAAPGEEEKPEAS